MHAVKLDHSVEPVERQPAPEIVIDGDGSSLLWNAVDVGEGELLSGMWVGQPGTLTVRPRPHHEIFTVIEGLVELTDSTGSVQLVGPGEGAYIPKGWSGTWRNVQVTKKSYVLLKSVGNEAGSD